MSCSTAPLPRMQCDTRHREMAAKVQGKHTVIYGSGICCQIRNRDLISSKSSSLYESRWGGVCSARSCSALNLLPFLISRSRLQSRHLSWPPHQEPQVDGREMRCPSTGWVAVSIVGFEAFRVRREFLAKSPKETVKKGVKEKFQSRKTIGAVGSAPVFGPTFPSDLGQVMPPVSLSLSAKCSTPCNYAFSRTCKGALSTEGDKKNTKSRVQRSEFKSQFATLA